MMQHGHAFNMAGCTASSKTKGNKNVRRSERRCKLPSNKGWGLACMMSLVCKNITNIERAKGLHK